MKESCIYCDNLLFDGFCYTCYYSDCANWSLGLDTMYRQPDFYDFEIIDIYTEEDEESVLFV